MNVTEFLLILWRCEVNKQAKAVLDYFLILILSISISSCAITNGSGLSPEQTTVRAVSGDSIPFRLEKAWYRKGNRGFTLLAYNAAGELTITEKRIKLSELDIPVEAINTINWGKMGIDLINDWAIVDYGQPQKLIGFKDGSLLGSGPDTDLIYSALKYIHEIVHGNAPSTNGPFVSAWLSVFMGGLMATADEGLTLNLILSNISKSDIWAEVYFYDKTIKCKNARRILVNENVQYSCGDIKIEGDVEYPIYIHVFTDEDKTVLVEKMGTKLSFTAENIKALTEAAESL